MNKTYVIFLFVFNLTITGTFAQITFGPKAGINVSTLHKAEVDAPDMHGVKTTYSYNIGFHVGGTIDIPINKDCSIRPELLFSQGGYDFNRRGLSGDVYSQKSRWGMIMLPVNIIGNLPINDHMKILIFTGPYASFVVGGNYSSNWSMPNYESESGSGQIKGAKKPTGVNNSNYYINPWDVGLNVGMGIQVKKFVFSAAFRQGFMNTEAHYENDAEEKHRGKDFKYFNRAFTFGFSYLFSGK